MQLKLYFLLFENFPDGNNPCNTKNAYKSGFIWLLTKQMERSPNAPVNITPLSNPCIVMTELAKSINQSPLEFLIIFSSDRSP